MSSTMIILLDSYSRSVIKTDVAEIAMQGVMFVNNLAEIPDNILKENMPLNINGHKLE